MNVDPRGDAKAICGGCSEEGALKGLCIDKGTCRCGGTELAIGVETTG